MDEENLMEKVKIFTLALHLRAILDEVSLYGIAMTIIVITCNDHICSYVEKNDAEEEATSTKSFHLLCYVRLSCEQFTKEMKYPRCKHAC